VSDAADVLVRQTKRRELRNRSYNFAMAAVVFVTCLILVIGGLVLYVKIDGKVSTTESSTAKTQRTVEAIRQAQIINLANSVVVEQCEIGDFNDAFKALALAFAGDKNVADYPKAVVCSVPTAPIAPKGTKKK
jgi:hypothetical protein